MLIRLGSQTISRALSVEAALFRSSWKADAPNKCKAALVSNTTNPVYFSDLKFVTLYCIIFFSNMVNAMCHYIGVLFYDHAGWHIPNLHAK